MLLVFLVLIFLLNYRDKDFISRCNYFTNLQNVRCRSRAVTSFTRKTPKLLFLYCLVSSYHGTLISFNSLFIEETFGPTSMFLNFHRECVWKFIKSLLLTRTKIFFRRSFDKLYSLIYQDINVSYLERVFLHIIFSFFRI